MVNKTFSTISNASARKLNHPTYRNGMKLISDRTNGICSQQVDVPEIHRDWNREQGHANDHEQIYPQQKGRD